MSLYSGGTANWQHIETQVSDLVRRGIDCRQWAQSHALTFSETPAVNLGAHRQAVEQAARRDRLAARAALVPKTPAHEVNDGVCDERRIQRAETAS